MHVKKERAEVQSERKQGKNSNRRPAFVAADLMVPGAHHQLAGQNHIIMELVPGMGLSAEVSLEGIGRN